MRERASEYARELERERERERVRVRESETEKEREFMEEGSYRVNTRFKATPTAEEKQHQHRIAPRWNRPASRSLVASPCGWQSLLQSDK